MRWSILVAYCMVASPGAAGPSLGIFADRAGTSCNIEQAIPGPGVLYILCELGGAASEGIRAAEIGVAGWPPDWVANVVPSPRAAATLWHPLQGGGVVLFPDCEAGDGAIVLVYTIEYYALGPPVSHHVLTATRNEHRIDPNFQCPLVKVCDDVPEIRLCVPASGAVINGPPCTVGVEASTWARLKGLYQ